MKPWDKIRPWKHVNAFERVEACVAMLNLHDFLGDGERARVEARIDRWRRQHGAERGTGLAPVKAGRR